MATLRQFIRDMTSLPVGSTIRNSIENPKTTGEPGETIYIEVPGEVNLIKNITLQGSSVAFVDDPIEFEIEDVGHDFSLEEVEEMITMLDENVEFNLEDEVVEMEMK